MTARLPLTAAVLCIALGASSCVPLAVGAAAGYVARDRGVGVVRPYGQNGSVYVDPPTHEEIEEYEREFESDYGEFGYDEPVY